MDVFVEAFIVVLIVWMISYGRMTALRKFSDIELKDELKRRGYLHG